MLIDSNVTFIKRIVEIVSSTIGSVRRSNDYSSFRWKGRTNNVTPSFTNKYNHNKYAKIR